VASGPDRNRSQPLAPAPRFATRLNLRTAGSRGPDRTASRPRERASSGSARDCGHHSKEWVPQERREPGSVQDSQSLTDTETHGTRRSGTQFGSAPGSAGHWARGRSSYKFRVGCASAAPRPLYGCEQREGSGSHAQAPFGTEEPEGIGPSRTPRSRVRTGPRASQRLDSSRTPISSPGAMRDRQNAARIAPVSGGACGNTHL
jgi:hypothetical protein